MSERGGINSVVAKAVVTVHLKIHKVILLTYMPFPSHYIRDVCACIGLKAYITCKMHTLPGLKSAQLEI